MHARSSGLLETHQTSQPSAQLRAASPLIRAKLIPPSVPTPILSRPRLLKRLTDYVSRKLTLLVAPGGYGKTVLLSDWYKLHQSESSEASVFAWLTLDRNNNQIESFWSYVVAAFGEQQPDLAHQLADALLNTQNHLETQTILFNNILGESPHKIVLVLDDYHTINNPAIDQIISALLEHLPPNAQIVIASRSVPQLPLALLRTRGQLLELNSNDLAFRFDEIDSLVRELWQVKLAKSDISLLEKRSEGWVTGIHLMVQIMQQSSDPRWISETQHNASILGQIKGSHPFFATYFYEEVLAPQPPELQRFLIDSSLLDTLDPELCEALFEHHAAIEDSPDCDVLSLPPYPHTSYVESVLIEAIRQNLFIQATASERLQARFHPLFREMLRFQLDRHEPSVIAKLHRRAAHVYEARGQKDAAVPHALASGDYTWTAELIETSARDLLLQGELRTVRQWLKALPDELSHDRPALLLLQSWMALFSGDLAKAQAYQQAAAKLLGLETAAASIELYYELEAINTMLILLSGDLSNGSEHAQALVRDMPPEASFAHSSLFLALNTLELLRGDTKAAMAFLHESLHSQRSNNNLFMVVMSLLLLAECNLKQGKLGLAKMLFEQAIELSLSAKRQPLPIAGKAYIGLGELLREQNELEDAERALLKGIELSQDSDELASLEGYIALTRLYQAKRDFAAARDALARARMSLLETNIPLEQSMLAVLEAQLAFQDGKQSIALEWLKTSQIKLQPQPIVSFQNKQKQLLSIMLGCQMLSTDARYDQALLLLEPHLEQAEYEGSVPEMATLLACQALLHFSRNELTSALQPLKRALNLAASAGLVRSLLDLGQPFVELLRRVQALAQQGSPLVAQFPLDYIAHLLSFEPSQAKQIEAKSATGSTNQLLSKRELDILRQIAAGLSTNAIAERFVVAPSTIKSHIKNIFSKLDVHTRAQALARAQELQLLS